MGVYSPSGPGSNVNVSTDDLVFKGDPVVSRLTLPGVANTEDSIVFATTTKFFRIRAQGNAKLLISYVAAGSATGWTISPGNIYSPPLAGLLERAGTLTLYLQSNKASTLVEVETWS